MRADIGDLIGDDGALDLVRAIENGSTHLIKKLVIRTRRIAGATGESSTDSESADASPIEETAYEIVLHDSQSAARHLARILHLEVKHRRIEARRPTDDELAHRMADLLERARANGRREAARQRPPTQTTESDSENRPEPSFQRQMPTDLRHARGDAGSSTRPMQENPANRGAAPLFSAAQPDVESRGDDSQQRSSNNAGESNLVRNGLWNRVFGAAEMLTFINPLKTPFKSSDSHARLMNWSALAKRHSDVAVFGAADLY
jgi:hypothetical protein